VRKCASFQLEEIRYLAIENAESLPTRCGGAQHRELRESLFCMPVNNITITTNPAVLRIFVLIMNCQALSTKRAALISYNYIASSSPPSNLYKALRSKYAHSPPPYAMHADQFSTRKQTHLTQHKITPLLGFQLSSIIRPPGFISSHLPEFINQIELDQTALVDQATHSFPARPKHDQQTALK
jgi:hypothetical protein